MPTPLIRAVEADEYNANDLLPLDSGDTVLSVNDINDGRTIVGTCETDAGEIRACIIHVTDPAIPVDRVKPTVRIDYPSEGAIIGDVVTPKATALDDWSRMDKVIFKIDSTRLNVDTSPPYTAHLDPSGLAAGAHVIKATAVGNAGNRRTKKIAVTVAAATVPNPTPPPPPTPAPPPPAGEVIEGSGTITALGSGSLSIDGLTVFYDESTAIKFNDVTDFALGLEAQFKAIQDADGTVTATDHEIN